MLFVTSKACLVHQARKCHIAGVRAIQKSHSRVQISFRGMCVREHGIPVASCSVIKLEGEME